jgi:hypothetical protein
MNFEEILDHAIAHAPAPRTRHLSEEVYDREPSRYQMRIRMPAIMADHDIEDRVRSPLLLSYCSPAWRIIVSAQAWSSGARGGIQDAA